MSDPALLSATELVAAYRAKSLSPVEAAEACFARLDRFEPRINAFIHVARETARQEARASEARWVKGEPAGPVDGVPTTIKDNIPQQRLPRRNGSKTTSDAAFEVGRDSPAGMATRNTALAWLSWSPYSYPFNLTQQPAASCPCGFTEDGLPIGLQIVAPKMRDDLVLQASCAFESARPFRMPA